MAAGKRNKTAGGRVNGTPNKTTRVLHEAVILAAEQVGEDGRGSNGLVGYLTRLARDEQKVFGHLLSRFLPDQEAASEPRPVQLITSDMSAEEATALYAESLNDGQSRPR
jgi:hypothetical protein